MSENLHQLRCFGCGSRIAGAEAQPDFRCAQCGDLFEVEYPGWNQRGGPDRPNPGALKWLWRERRCSSEGLDQSGVWRFRELLPILESFGNAVSLREGNTPLYHLPRAAKALGIDQLFAKHQGMNPSGSFKDTGMTAALSVARERGFEWVACASTGNTSASMAAYAARAGLNSLVLIPDGKIAWGKLSQAMDYGALTCQVKADFDGCLRLLTQVVKQAPIYLLNSVNPYRLEGQKTPAFEIAEAFDWNVPDHVIVPGGNLGNSSALGKGFRELRELGLVARLPKISVIQAVGANPLVRSLRDNHGAVLEPVEAHTRATAIRIGNPASWRKAARVIEETGGQCLDVTEAEIAIAKAEIGAEGLGCEPASAVTLAGSKKLRARDAIRPADTVVLVLTGHTLKDADYTIDFHRGTLLTDEEKQGTGKEIEALRRNAVNVEATPEAVLAALKGSKG
ncbi:Threonine synthase [Candidatus Sulfotelmatomonas gaucii]|uniref:Threonine synthase n=1 Tax=Candidatus Sulfuritelmatomonas gaucii TaxID=2043161 RepID=A0A2N9LTN7_9BACT|nr:Threonine synthase [Candidatus Sulfotelmatomonas gaucii]